MNDRTRLMLAVCVAMCLSVSARGRGPVHVNARDAVAPDGELATISVDVPVGDWHAARAETGDHLTIDGYGRLLVPGTPNLPSKTMAIAIPPGATIVDVQFELGQGITLPGTYDIPPALLPGVIGDEDPEIRAAWEADYAQAYADVYSGDAAYPAVPVQFVRAAGYRRYHLADVRVTPMAYHPQSGQVTYYPDITVHVRYTPAPTPNTAPADSLAKTEDIARDLIVNYHDAQQFYPQVRTASRSLYDYVIITLDTLTASVTPLVDWETAKGRTVNVVTTTWINGNYSGFDLSEKIRNFLREKHPSGEWGIEDVLIVGHYDDVPIRRTAQDLGYGRPETDFYFAELSLPDNQSWDADGDHQWGENSDPIDFYSEVNVGRIPWSSPALVQHICEKSVAYEMNSDPAFKKNILLLGAFFWDDDPNPRTDNAVLMEAKVDQPWMSDWTMTRLYEQGYSTYPMDYNLNWNNATAVWSNGTFAFVNWAGHGSPTSSHIYHGTVEGFVSTATCPYLNEDYPAIMFADACSNGDTDHVNLGQSMIQQGGVGFLGSTKVALGCPGWNGLMDGSTQSLDYLFTTYVTSGDYTQGQAHQQALRDMYTYGLFSYNKYETFEWGALLGNPDLSMRIFDCNSNGIPDPDDIADCDGSLWCADCNNNGMPDGCEPDCDNDGVADACEILDCDGSPECADCNGNGIPDRCDIALATSEDCNANAIPDDCEVSAQIIDESGTLSPIGSGSPQSYTIPAPVPQVNDIVLTFTSMADLGGSHEYIDVYINNHFVGQAFESAGGDCPPYPVNDQLIVDAATFNTALDGQTDAVILLLPNSSVDPDLCLGGTWISFTITCASFGSNDTNQNGIPDDCEGLCPEDLDGQAGVGQGDLNLILNRWGDPECLPGGATHPCPEDIDGLNGIGQGDLTMILNRWGDPDCD